MKQRNASHAVAALAAVVAIGGAGLTAGAQSSQPYPPAPGVPVPTEPANRIPQGESGATVSAPNADRAPRAAEKPTSDADFVRMLTAANTAELDQAKFMVNRTTNPMVRTFAQRMIDDHSMAAVKLQAATRGVAIGEPPPRMTVPSEVRGIEVLAMLSGPQRDTAYMRMQVAAHRRAISLMQWESEKGKVASLKALATELLPTVSTHAQMALAYQATGGTSMAIDPAAPSATSPSGMLPTGPATTSGTTGSTNAAGASRSTNTITNPSQPPTLAQPTPAPNQPASPMPSSTPH